MPTAIPDGGGDDLATNDLQAYNAVKNIPEGERTAEQAELAEDIEAQAAALAQGWDDSGGPGGFQVDVSAEVLLRAATLQGQVQSSVRQWAKQGRERAMLEMLGSLQQALIERDRLLLELRERLNASPY